MKFTLHQEFPLHLEPEWNALLEQSVTHVPFLRHEYLETWWQTRGGGEWQSAELAIVTARNDQEELIGIAPFFIAKHAGRPTLLLLGSIEVSDYLDLIVRREDLPAFLEGLLPFLQQCGLRWQTAELYNLLEDSPVPAALQAAAERLGWSAVAERLQHAPYIALPGDWETYLAGIDKKQRHEVRRKMRRAESADVPARWYIVDQAETLSAEVDAFIALMAQDPDKAAFLTEPMREFMRAAAGCAFGAGCLHLAFLEIGGEKAAGYFSFDYLNRLWVYNSGIDRRFNEYSPGWVLLGYLLRWANENKRAEFDFMRGDEEYKYRFGAADRFVVRLTLRPA